MKKVSALLAVAGLAAAVTAQAAIPTLLPVPTSLYGDTAATAQANRVIEIAPNTTSVNVKWGDTVEFKANGKSFAYTFDGSRVDPSVNLQRLAPAGTVDHPVMVYVRDFPGNTSLPYAVN